MELIAVLGTLAAIICAPWLAAKVMGVEGGPGKGALVGFVTLGVTQIIAMVAQHLGPLGGVLGFMGALAGWYQVIKVIHGTDTARTLVFMFWHLFFQLLFVSLLSLLFSFGAVSWIWGL
jgi:hypothetical protein